tara:strand:- start:634 stop:846 length:213 start_codon:yes stop_codon:yes gene_type:complete
MTAKEDIFENIWSKESNTMREKIKSKVIVRGFEPTREHCLAYWLGKMTFVRTRRETRKGHYFNEEWRIIA